MPPVKVGITALTSIPPIVYPPTPVVKSNVKFVNSVVVVVVLVVVGAAVVVVVVLVVVGAAVVVVVVLVVVVDAVQPKQSVLSTQVVTSVQAAIIRPETLVGKVSLQTLSVVPSEIATTVGVPLPQGVYV